MCPRIVNSYTRPKESHAGLFNLETAHVSKKAMKVFFESALELPTMTNDPKEDIQICLILNTHMSQRKP